MADYIIKNVGKASITRNSLRCDFTISKDAFMEKYSASIEELPSDAVQKITNAISSKKDQKLGGKDVALFEIFFQKIQMEAAKNFTENERRQITINPMRLDEQKVFNNISNSHVPTMNNASSFLETTLPQKPTTNTTSSILNSYKLVSNIAQGGMGEISLVSEIKTGRFFALKHFFAHAYGCAENCEEYWHREQEIMKIQSHSPVRALQFQTAFKQPSHTGTIEYYILMEYIQGITLEAWIKQNAGIPDLNAIKNRLKTIILPLCRHLDYVHTQGIIHRDITPRNIMILSEGDRIIPVLIDWGVAKLQSASRIVRAQSETAATTISSVGNPPEVLAGFDPVIASDIYMMGNILYYICSGGKTVKPLREAEYVLNLENVNLAAPTELNFLIQAMTQFDSGNRIQPFRFIIEKLELIIRE